MKTLADLRGVSGTGPSGNPAEPCWNIRYTFRYGFLCQRKKSNFRVCPEERGRGTFKSVQDTDVHASVGKAVPTETTASVTVQCGYWL